MRVTAEKALQPARLASFHIEVTAPPLEERHENGLLRAVKACVVHNTLTGNPKIEIALTTEGHLPVPSLQSGLGPERGNPVNTPPLEWRA